MFASISKNILDLSINFMVTLYSTVLHLKPFGITKISACQPEDDVFNSHVIECKLNSIYKNIAVTVKRCNTTDKKHVLANYSAYNKANLASTLRLSTSGTTGQGLSFPVDRYFLRSQWSVFRKQFEECGVYGSWRVQFGGRDVKVLGKRFTVVLDYFDKKVISNQYSLGDDQVRRLAEICKAKRIYWLHGYPSMIYEFLSVWNRLYEVGELKFKPADFVVTVSSETLTKQVRKELLNLGATRIFDMYGQTEGVANFFTCQHGRMHVHEDFSLVEFIYNGAVYDIIGTSIKNKLFQFYRYKTGDTVEAINIGDCPCGRKSRTVEGLTGRSEDYVITTTGFKVGRLDHLTKGDNRIKRAQIIQNEIGVADFIIQCEPDHASQVTKDIRKRCDAYFGDDLHFNFIMSSDFEFKANGKFTFVLNKIKSHQ